MKQLTFYLDFISPYAHLAFGKLPQALEGLSYSVEYRPVLFGAMLKHLGQLGPAEIAGKREWTYREVLWKGHEHGIAIEMPAAHPFNPLALLRLAIACGGAGQVNRYVTETIFRHVWQGGADASDPARLAELRTRLAPARDPDGDDVKAELRANTEAAIAAGAFGVPTVATEGRLFWGMDGLPMLRRALEGDPWFDAHWDSAASVVQGIKR